MADEEKRPEEEAESAKTEESSAEAATTEATATEATATEEVVTVEAATADAVTADVVTTEPLATEVAPATKDDHGHSDHAAPGDHGHAHAGDHGHGDHGGHDEHFAHTAPASMLIGVFVALILLTILTVGVTAVDLGANGNLVVAMVIATVKAVLVMGFFMHMFWDSKFNVVAFTSSFLFVILFLAMALADRGEYQDTIDHFEADKKAIELAK